MPHQIIEFSANLASRLDINALVATLHEQAAQLPALPLAGLRTRAYPAHTYQIADNHPDNGFIAVYLRIGAGRDEALRIEMGEALFQRLCEFVSQTETDPPFALSYEVQEIDTGTRWNKNHLRRHVEARGSAAQ